ncbi:MAG: LysR family transcriptional regulator substrate-binding protein [Nesterenkonia sp.]
MILGAIPGATPDKWVARWRDRYPDLPLQVHYYDDAGSGSAAQLQRIRSGTVDVGYIRLTEEAEEIDKDLFHRVLLYREDPVVCAAADHWIGAAETSVSAEEIADEPILDPTDMVAQSDRADIDTPQTGTDLAHAERLAVETAATGACVVVLPASVARVLSRKDVVIRTVEGMAGYQTGLAWLRERDSDMIQEFIGVARGRRAGSGRSAVQASNSTTSSSPKVSDSSGKQPKQRGRSGARPGSGARGGKSASRPRRGGR